MNYWPLLLLLICSSTWGQTFEDEIVDIMGDDLEVGGDIFSNFNDDPQGEQVAKDERFYRHGRFYSLNVGLGVTTFTGNRGNAYNDNHPTYSVSFTHFFDFQNAAVMGIQFSSHTMILDSVTAIDDEAVGRVDTSFLRPFVGYRFYFDTADLSRAITYANPYFTVRFEYWYQNNKFVENGSIPNQSGGGIGASFGLGLELPIEIKESYWGIELLLHQVNTFDRETTDYRRLPGETDSPYGYEDLNGTGVSFVVNYVFSW